MLLACTALSPMCVRVGSVDGLKSPELEAKRLAIEQKLRMAESSLQELEVRRMKRSWPRSIRLNSSP